MVNHETSCHAERMKSPGDNVKKKSLRYLPWGTSICIEAPGPGYFLFWGDPHTNFLTPHAIIECPLCVECLLRALLALSASIVVPRRTTTPRFRFRKWAYIKSHRDNGLSISLTVPCPLKKCKHSTQRKTYINTGQRDNKLTHPACSKISSHLTSHQNMLETKMHRHCTLICTG